MISMNKALFNLTNEYSRFQMGCHIIPSSCRVLRGQFNCFFARIFVQLRNEFNLNEIEGNRNEAEFYSLSVSKKTS